MSKKQCPLIKIEQWLPSWEMRNWSKDDGPGAPPREFFLGSMKIRTLRRLAGVDARELDKRKASSPAAGYQRVHQRERSKTIARYIQYGYPISTQKGIDPSEHKDLINPGWLPTAILMNIIPENGVSVREGKELRIDNQRQVIIRRTGEDFFLEYPAAIDSEDTWDWGGDTLEPLQIIDGQHRLFSVELDDKISGDYSVPVVFFNNLAPQWQAYLFWVINVEPKRINTSLAFDLYPELRKSTWLERGEGIKVYQEHRAQELTEVLWRHNLSPWRERIELFGKRIDGHVSNAAFIRTLAASFIRRWRGNSEDTLSKVGGLFGSMDIGGRSYIVPWKRAQQAAFLILMWDTVRKSVERSSADWVVKCRQRVPGAGVAQSHGKSDAAFSGQYTLLATDQGVRAVSVVFNALFQIYHEKLKLAEWVMDDVRETDDEAVTDALDEINRKRSIVDFMERVSGYLVEGFDWRTSSEPSIAGTPAQNKQGAYRGSSGYALLQREVMYMLAKVNDAEISKAAIEAIALLGWQKEVLEGN